MHTSPANHPSTSGLQIWPNELFLPLRLWSTRTPSNVRKQIEYNKERVCKVLLFAALYLICKSKKMSELHYTEEKKCLRCQSSTWDPFSSVYLMYLFYLDSLFFHLQKETKWKKVSCGNWKTKSLAIPFKECFKIYLQHWRASLKSVRFHSPAVPWPSYRGMLHRWGAPLCPLHGKHQKLNSGGRLSA